MRCNIFQCHVPMSSTCGLSITSSDALSLRFVRVWPSNCIQKHISLFFLFCFPNKKLYFKAFSGIQKPGSSPKIMSMSYATLVTNVCVPIIDINSLKSLHKQLLETITIDPHYARVWVTQDTSQFLRHKKVTRRRNLLFSNHCKAWR